jgi:hypothetical protein
MFYAKSNPKQKIEIYLTLLDKSLHEGSTSNYWNFFVNAFSNAHLLASGKKTYYDVDRKMYDIVKVLVQSNPSFFRDLDVNTISDKTFINVRNFIGTLKESKTVVNG